MCRPGGQQKQGELQFALEVVPVAQTLKLSNGRTLSSLAAVILAQCHVPLVLDIEQRKLNASRRTAKAG
jgi:hypothetical protein